MVKVAKTLRVDLGLNELNSYSSASVQVKSFKNCFDQNTIDLNGMLLFSRLELNLVFLRIKRSYGGEGMSTKHFFTRTCLFFALLIGVSACSSGVPPFGGSSNPLSGQMYSYWNFSLYRTDLVSSASTILYSQFKKTPQMPDLGYFDRSEFDVSADGKEILLLTEPKGNEFSDTYVFNLVSSDNLGDVRNSFQHYRHGLTSVKLSLDKSRIAIAGDYYDQPSGSFPRVLEVLDRTGKLIVKYTTDDAGKSFKEAVWLPDGNLLMITDSGLFKTDDLTLSHATKLTNAPFASWGFISSSPDGKRLAFTSGGHVFTMNLNGSGLVQVTDSDSDSREYAAQWSPDGKYLAFRTDIFVYTIGGPVEGGGTLYKLIVVPADGKKYVLKKSYSETIGSTIIGTATISGSDGVIAVKQKDGVNYATVNVENDVSWR
jgi:hypothetical protein